MARSYGKSSPADTAALLVMIILILTIIVLFGIYFLRQNGILQFDTASAEDLSPHVISSETSAVAGTSAATVSVPSVPAEDMTVSVTSATTATAVSESTAGTQPISETDVSDEEEYKNPAVPASSEYDEEFYDDVFMIGDSLSVGFINYGYLKEENVFSKVGLTPSSVMSADVDEETVYTKITEADPKYICIMLGTNGLSYLSLDYMAEKMGEFIDSVAEICPSSEIAVISIPPVTAKHERENPENLMNISLYNNSIKKVAEEKSVLFVDTFSLLQGVTGYLADDYAENDGLHFKTAAYPVILSAIQTAFTDEGSSGSDTETVTDTEAITVWEPSAAAPVTQLPETQTEETSLTVNILLP